MNALLDYGSSSNESDDDSIHETTKEAAKPKLPKPSLGENALHCSVFSNPFVEAELAKAAILEKHVKMVPITSVITFGIFRQALYRVLHTIVKYIGDDCKVPGKDGTQMINGKRICWNYRKGRCRFGHNCKYAHDSDVQKTQDEIEAEKRKIKSSSVVCESGGSVLSALPPVEEETIQTSTDDALWEGSGPAKKKRPGLSQNLVPGKKVLDIYKKQKIKDNHRNK